MRPTAETFATPPSSRRERAPLLFLRAKHPNSSLLAVGFRTFWVPFASTNLIETWRNSSCLESHRVCPQKYPPCLYSNATVKNPAPKTNWPAPTQKQNTTIHTQANKTGQTCQKRPGLRYPPKIKHSPTHTQDSPKRHGRHASQHTQSPFSSSTNTTAYTAVPTNARRESPRDGCPPLAHLPATAARERKILPDSSAAGSGTGVGGRIEGESLRRGTCHELGCGDCRGGQAGDKRYVCLRFGGGGRGCRDAVGGRLGFLS